jgi:alpha-glucosidase
VSRYHHDGSARYVSTLAPDLGETVTVFVRGPLASGERLYVRSTPDGEPRFVEAVVDRVEGGVTWWRAPVEVRNLVTGYRFLVTGTHGYRWLTAAGLFAHDVTDATDFRLVAHPAAPSWAADAIVYEIFPDRFARSAAAAERPHPDWAIPCDWGTPVIGRGPETRHQLYGGDLDGVAEHLDHIAALGANTVYLTPIFPARSNHRYDAASFDEVDPILGGTTALRRLSHAIRARGMRLLGDITTNHTGEAHPCFTGPDRKELYYAHDDGSYESWLGVASLPKLDWGSAELRRRFFDGDDSITARWLTDLDGWRVDVANMTGRLGADDYAHEVARLMARAVRAANPQALLVAEHAHDATGDLDRGGWQGTMNYAGFTRPVWSWLAPTDAVGPDFLGVPAAIVPRDGAATVATMRAFSSRMSWSALTSSWNLLGSHDTPRVRTVLGDGDRVEAALGLLATMPGTPMVFAGDEWAMTGVNGEDSRRPMPWDRPESQDATTLRCYQRLLGLRAARPALRHGGLRFVEISADALVYWRETERERVLVAVRRAAGEPVRVDLDGATAVDNVYGGLPCAVSDGFAVVPGDGPTVQVWVCAG